ncbi:hypothetical protein NLI96_g11532 [Meripilus lineatus]|uniref:Protein kinase domain-containing protein n=1 Tax=Meripilus lineatus TaxID=2056292 RepID=A0AAD5URN7_9APHY|nr:hypothetical protein NLI96_g11532 [Physisporinus lineatus]
MLIIVKRTSLEDLPQLENQAEAVLTHFSHSESTIPFDYVDRSDVSMASPLLPKGSRPNLKPIPIAKESGPWSMDLVVEDPPSVAHYERLDSEFRDYFVGPVPKDFFRELLPEATSSMPHLRSSLVGTLAQFNPMGEEQLLCRILNKHISPHLGGGFRLTANNSLGIPYHSEHPQHDESALFQDNKDLTVSRDLETSELHFEVKVSVSDDPFRDHNPLLRTRASHRFLKSGPDHATRRGQLLAYATHACARQHRQFYYSVLIYHHRVRIIRWDRSGALVSESFDCSNAEGIALLGDFLWRFTHAAPSARGWDPTVLIASKEDESAFAQHPVLKEWYEEGSVAKLLTWDQEKERFLELLVSCSAVSPLSMVGRGTRGFWALDKATGLVVFVKDTWRVCGMEPEGHIIQKLLDHKVRNIPELQSHGDVPDGKYGFQHTWTQQYVSDYYCGRNPRILQYAHYRLVSKTVGHSLAHAPENSRQLLTATRDAFQALSDAYNACGLMHRDISIGNIIIDRVSRKGILIDWEAAHEFREGDSKTPARSGTWQFMAHELLRRPKTLHLPYHDIESFFWVVFYATILWFASKVDVKRVQDLIHDLFDYHRFDNEEEQVTGGEFKKVALQNDECVNRTHLPPTSILYAWLKKFRVLCLRLDTDLFKRPTVEKTFETFDEAWRALLKDESYTSENRFVRKALTIETHESDIVPIATYPSGSYSPKADIIPSPTSLPTRPFLQTSDLPRIKCPSTAPVLNNPLKRQHEPVEYELRSQDSGKRRKLSNDVGGPSGSQAKTQTLSKSQSEHAARNNSARKSSANGSNDVPSRPKTCSRTSSSRSKAKGKRKARAP